MPTKESSNIGKGGRTDNYFGFGQGGGEGEREAPVVKI